MELFSSNSNPHLIKLLATYEQNKQFHLIFPFARDDLRGYWANHIPQFDSPTVTWLLKQLHGLVSGLGALHSAMLPAATKSRGHPAEQMQFRHGDLKPENILRFEDDAGGTLKIADLGLGGFHKHSMVTPETVISTVTYAPPELDHSMKENISQAFDIWSLGCVYLEFITWLLTGSNGVESFADARLSMTEDGIRDDAFHDIIRDRTEFSVPVEVRPSVVDWVEKLHENPACSQVVHELLDIVLEEMLAVVPSERASASQLEHELHVLLLRAEKDQHFLLDPQPISFETTPDDLIEHTDTTYLDAASSSLPSDLTPEPMEPPKTYPLRPLPADTNESHDSTPSSTASDEVPVVNNYQSSPQPIYLSPSTMAYATDTRSITDVNGSVGYALHSPQHQQNHHLQIINRSRYDYSHQHVDAREASILSSQRLQEFIRQKYPFYVRNQDTRTLRQNASQLLQEFDRFFTSQLTSSSLNPFHSSFIPDIPTPRQNASHLFQEFRRQEIPFYVRVQDIPTSRQNDLGEGLYKRILSPREYFSPLQSLEQTVTECSLVSSQVADTMLPTDELVDLDQVRAFGKRLITHADGTGYPMQLPPPFSGIERFDEYITQICAPGQKASVSYENQRGIFRDILTNAKAIHQVRKNVERMQKSQFCAGKISLLTLDAYQTSIVRLISIDVGIFERISAGFDELVHIYIHRYISNGWEAQVSEWPSVLRPLKSELWVQLGLHSESSYVTPDKSLPEIWCWSIIISALDLGVVSYAGAHIENFNEYFGSSKLVNIRVGEYLGQPATEAFPIFRQRRLKCLDKFLHGLPVWVLHPDDQEDDGRLLLGTDVDTFSDIWGPLWKWSDNDDGETRMFAVGNGCIIRSTLNERDNIELSENEMYCHWIADEEIKTFSAKDFQPIPANASLLIGGGQFSPLHIKECQRTVTSVRNTLKNRNCLQVPGTASPTKYLDGENWAVQGGFSVAGVSATATHQRAYKRRAGQPLKAALVELWANEPDMRDFRILDMICGVRISWCTQHAQRVSLLDILRSDTMESYMERWKPFVDDKDAHTAYFKRIRRKDFNASWIIQKGGPEQRKLIGDALLICLKALNRTGVVLEGDDEGRLQALWAPPEEPEKIVLISKRGHEWIGLLEDTVSNGSMVIFEPICLRFSLLSVEQTQFAECQYTIRRRRRDASQETSSKAVLQTALDVNNDFLERIPGVDRVATTETEHAWRDNVDGICRRWSFSDEVNGFKIELGPRTYLQVVNKHKEFLLVQYATFVVPGGVLNIGRRRPKGYHRELIDHKSRVALEPISLCVL